MTSDSRQHPAHGRLTLANLRTRSEQPRSLWHAGAIVALMVLVLAWSPRDSRGEEAPGPEVFQSNFDTSTPAIAPPWSLRPWYWEGDQFTAEAVWDFVHGCETHDLPIGTVLIDAPWTTAYNNFRFDERHYPHPKEMIDQLHGHGVRVVLWMTNFIDVPNGDPGLPGDPEDLYAIGKARGYFVNGGEPMDWWNGRGALIDYTNPAAIAWWHSLMDRVLSMGIDGWKVDGGAELFGLTPRLTSRGTLSVRDYIDLYYRDSLNYGRCYKPDFVTVVRAVDIANSLELDFPHAPLDAAPLTWLGDQRHSWNDKGIDEASRSFLRSLDRGYPLVSSDTGGYQTPSKSQAEVMPRLLYARWAQWNAWTPFFLIGGHDEHRPWKFDPAFLAMFRRYLWLHEELIPFFYSQHVQASLREGKLMHRGPGASEFQLGDAFLVGIMDTPEPAKEMTFPEGTWLDYWDNRREYAGGTTARVSVPEDRNPVFVRKGAIVALDVRNDVAGHGSAASAGWRTLDCYPGAAESRAAVWDTTHFPPELTRDRTWVTVSPSEMNLKIRIEGGVPRKTILRILRPESTASVRCDGQPLPQHAQKADWEKAASGWWYDAADRRLWIRVPEAQAATVDVVAGDRAK